MELKLNENGTKTTKSKGIQEKMRKNDDQLIATKQEELNEVLIEDVIDLLNERWPDIYIYEGEKEVAIDIVETMIDIFDDNWNEEDYNNSLKLKRVLLPAFRKMNENERLKKLKILFSKGRVTIDRKIIDLNLDPIQVYKRNTQQVTINKGLRQEVLDIIDTLYSSFLLDRNKDEIAIQIIESISMDYAVQNSFYSDIFEFPLKRLLRSFNENERLEYVKTLLTYGSVNINGEKFSMPDLPNLKGIKIQYGA